jgi:hypothetical protein
LRELTPIEHHAIWLEAHYAMGKLEVQQGFVLGWRERSSFIKNYIADKSQVDLSSSEIESNKANNK